MMAVSIVLSPSTTSVTAVAHGPVTLDGRALSDSDGPFLAVGATLFWALWGEAHDPDRLDANLAWLAERGVDYVRILGMVGTDSWRDRRIDPSSPDYWPTVDRFIERLARHRLRAQITIFADAQVMMPDKAARARFVERWAARINKDPDRFILAEIANEHYQNGIDDPRELRELGSALGATTAVLVALSAPAAAQACAVYAASGADLATMHYSRSFEKGNPWGPVERPWGYPREYDRACRTELPPAINNEPIGPRSSVEEESSPLRLAAAFVMTFIGQNAAYVLHSGAGIRGGGAGDRSLDRRANLFEVSAVDPALRGIRALRAALPADLPNWNRTPHDAPEFPFANVGDAIAQGRVHGAYGAARGDRFVAVFLGVQRPLDLQARTGLALEVVDPLGREAARQLTVRAGESVAVPPRSDDMWGDAVVIVGRRLPADPAL
jgi:hypothetical protein